MKSGNQLRNYAAHLANQEAETQRAVFNIAFVEAGFGLQLKCWQFNSRAMTFKIELVRKKRRTNVSFRAAGARQ
jgi:hypothetical protein